MTIKCPSRWSILLVALLACVLLATLAYAQDAPPERDDRDDRVAALFQIGMRALAEAEQEADKTARGDDCTHKAIAAFPLILVNSPNFRVRLERRGRFPLNGQTVWWREHFELGMAAVCRRRWPSTSAFCFVMQWCARPSTATLAQRPPSPGNSNLSPRSCEAQQPGVTYDRRLGPPCRFSARAIAGALSASASRCGAAVSYQQGWPPQAALWAGPTWRTAYTSGGDFGDPALSAPPTPAAQGWEVRSYRNQPLATRPPPVARKPPLRWQFGRTA